MTLAFHDWEGATDMTIASDAFARPPARDAFERAGRLAIYTHMLRKTGKKV